MGCESLPSRLDTLVPDPKLLAGFPDDGCDRREVALDYPREEVVGRLVVEGGREYIPEPAVGSVVHGSVDL